LSFAASKQNGESILPNYGANLSVDIFCRI